MVSVVVDYAALAVLRGIRWLLHLLVGMYRRSDFLLNWWFAIVVGITYVLLLSTILYALVWPSLYEVSASIFEKCMALVYLTAFVSFGAQADGLVGSKGILPAQKRVELYRSRLGQSPTWYLYPTLVLWGLADENVSVSSEGDAKTGGSVLPRFKFDTLLRFFWVSGMVVSLFISSGGSWLASPFLTSLCFLYLYVAYVAIKAVGQEWFALQFDNLLLEGGFSAILVSLSAAMIPVSEGGLPSRVLEISLIPVWLLVFRVMFSSGGVKLASGDPTWRDGTAMLFHYWTQPIVHPISWYWHHFIPVNFHILSSYLHFVIELAMPFLFFFPGCTSVRSLAAGAMVLLMLLITMTGCYGFFNINTIVLCMSAVSDDWLFEWVQVVIISNSPKSWVRRLDDIFPLFSANNLYHDDSGWIGIAAYYSLYLVVFFLTMGWVFLNVLCTFNLLVNVTRRKYRFPEKWVQAMNTPVLRYLFELELSLSSALTYWSLMCPYGLFARMTTDRGEVVLEGGDNLEEWHTIAFEYKADDIGKRPSFGAIGHLPRLDWRMWFLQLTDMRGMGFEELIDRLLRNGDESKHVWGLLSRHQVYSELNPPKYIRATLYYYEFSARDEPRAWWTRRMKLQRTFTHSLSSGDLVEIVE